MNEKKKILVTGALGQVGMELRELQAEYPEFDFRFTDYEDLDITDDRAVDAYVAAYRPDFIFNCAAYTAVDKAEEDVAKALAINSTGAGHLARAARDYGSTLFHISTDYVYDSGKNSPYIEGDPENPGGIYAITKLLGDRAVRLAAPGSIVFRTSWVYSAFGHNFVKTMRRLGRERPELRIVYDQIGSPTYARDLARAMLDVARQMASGVIDPDRAAGIYHFSNEGVASWYDFAKAIFEMEGITCRVVPILSAQYPTPARRPPFSLMDKSKFKETFGLEIPYWRDALSDCLRNIRKNES